MPTPASLRSRALLVIAAASTLLAGCGLGWDADPQGGRSSLSGGGTAAMSGRTGGVAGGDLLTAAPGSRTPAMPMDPVIAAIREEGLNRSQVMDILDTLCNVIGPRLTSSPTGVKASHWTRDQLESWGLSNAHLEEWGPFGRAWAVKRYSLQVISPVNTTLISFPKAWSPGLSGILESDVIHLSGTREEIEKHKGNLAGKVVLIGETRTVEAHFQPEGSRRTEEDLSRMAVDPAMLAGEAPKGDPNPRAMSPAERRAAAAEANPAVEAMMRRRAAQAQAEDAAATTRPGARGGRAATRPSARPAARGLTSQELFNFAAENNAALVLTPSSKGDGGTLFVQQMSMPGPGFTPGGGGGGGGATSRPRPWAKPAADAPYVPAQATLTIEDFNRLVRMINKGVTPRVSAELQVEVSDDERPSYNTIAEIPGTDPELKDQIVMVGAHLDSWHSASGATDNGAGSACAMEAVRIIQALGLKPRRTIRIGLWTGEEQGIIGSREYVTRHFSEPPPRGRGGPGGGGGGATTQPARKADYEKFSVYFNLDNGTGRIRGVYTQGNAAAVPVFAKWLAPFHDLDAKTITMRNTGGTDHLSFDAVGLPGFQFIQDPIEYDPRTHHSNQDNYDRIQAADMKQASTIMAAFLWNAAQMDDRFPRKPQQ